MDDINITSLTHKQKIPLSDGGEITYISTLPECDGLPKMSEFYKKIEEACRSYASEKLPSLVPHPADEYRYRLSCKTVCGEKNMTVALTVTLTDRTERRTVEKYEETHIWKDDMLRKNIKNTKNTPSRGA